MNNCGRIATDSRKMEKDHKTSVNVNLYRKMQARMKHGPSRYSMRKVSIDGSCVGLTATLQYGGEEDLNGTDLYLYFMR